MKLPLSLTSIIIVTAITTGFLFSSCDNPAEEDKGYEAPAPPTEINTRNVLELEFYSKLNGESLFDNTGYQTIIDNISNNTKTLAYFFDRSDAVIGETSPIVDIGWKTKTKSFFVQNDYTDTSIQGTGIIVRPIINNFEGTGIPDTLFVGGCTLMAPLGKAVTLTLSTCQLNDKYQFAAFVKALQNLANNNKLILGTIKSNIANDLAQYLKTNMKDFRLYESDNQEKPYQLFVLSPVSFVVRAVIFENNTNIPAYKFQIEYLN
ncbi:MAG: hypothetical protein M0Q54_08505 [Pigmentiphaga sp.]|nr:hypothetical protein [Pigmentiphaga sp.]